MANALMESPTTSLEALCQNISDISSLPTVAIEIMQIVNNPESSVNDLVRVLEMDPSLTARVLRVVNSAATGLRYETKSVSQAISHLGFSRVRDLAISASVADVFRGENRIVQYSRPRLWRHMISVAIASRMIAARFALALFDEAFMAGLLHDLGVILLDQHAHEPFVAILNQLAPGEPLVHREREVLGFDHCQIGAHMAEAWGFPPFVVTAVRSHHSADQEKGEHQLMARLVSLANYMCGCKQHTSVGTPVVEKPSLETLRALGITREDYRVLWEDLDEEFTIHQSTARI